MRAQRHHTPVTSYRPSQRDGWRAPDWFKDSFQTKLFNGLNRSRVTPAFAVPHQFDHKALELDAIVISIGGPKAHSKLFINSFLVKIALPCSRAYPTSNGISHIRLSMPLNGRRD
jgi:hypothetical protein